MHRSLEETIQIVMGLLERADTRGDGRGLLADRAKLAAVLDQPPRRPRGRDPLEVFREFRIWVCWCAYLSAKYRKALGAHLRVGGLALFFAGFIPAAIARSKGYSFGIWFVYGVLILPIALPHSLLLRTDPSALDDRAIRAGGRKCPRCAEIVKSEAVVCRYCGADLAPATVGVGTPASETAPMQAGVAEEPIAVPPAGAGPARPAPPRPIEPPQSIMFAGVCLTILGTLGLLGWLPGWPSAPEVMRCSYCAAARGALLAALLSLVLGLGTLAAGAMVRRPTMGLQPRSIAVGVQVASIVTVLGCISGVGVVRGGLLVVLPLLVIAALACVDAFGWHRVLAGLGVRRGLHLVTSVLAVGLVGLSSYALIVAAEERPEPPPSIVAAPSTAVASHPPVAEASGDCEGLVPDYLGERTPRLAAQTLLESASIGDCASALTVATDEVTQAMLSGEFGDLPYGAVSCPRFLGDGSHQPCTFSAGNLSMDVQLGAGGWVVVHVQTLE